MLRLTHAETPIGVEDDFPNAVIFMIETTLRWSEPVFEVLSSHAPWTRTDSNMTIAQLEESAQYILLSGRLYKHGIDHVLRLCLNPEDYDDAIAKADVKFGEIHSLVTQTIQQILLNGFWWPILNDDLVQ